MGEVEKTYKTLVKSFIFSFVLALITLIIGIYIGQSISKFNALSFYVKYRELYTKVEDYNTLIEISKFNCNKTKVFYLAKSLYGFGKEIGLMEKELGYKNEEVLFLKRLYNLLLIKYYFLLEELKSKCNYKDLILILFFYSNEKKYLDNSVKLGKVLDYVVFRLKREKNITIVVFPLESILLNLTSIDYLKHKFNVRDYEIPCIVIENKKICRNYDENYLVREVLK